MILMGDVAVIAASRHSWSGVGQLYVPRPGHARGNTHHSDGWCVVLHVVLFHLTAIMVCLLIPGGARNDAITELSQEQLTTLALDSLKLHLGLTATPDVVVAGVHQRCIPQPEVGHTQRVALIKEGLKSAFGSRFHLIGNSYDTGVGAVDCVAAAQKCAQNILGN